jgi:hypothetical protein
VAPGKQIRLTAHPKNIEARAAAAVGYDAAPLSALPWWGNGGDGTQPLRADHTCKIYSDGQLMGNSRMMREFPPDHNRR